MSDFTTTLPADQKITFNDFGLSDALIKALDTVGYETPTPIQAEIIPIMMSGRDVVGQAQTGTGKTAAFALPLLNKLDLKVKAPQVLVLAPTRELAIQVAEAFQSYAGHLSGFHVLPIYGGQDIGVQLKQLRRGAQVVVGTPGRVMDHMRRGTLNLDHLTTLVLDEADEMLRMGFIDDVEWILEKTPEQRQIALFSATMPHEIRRIAKKYLRDPQEVTIKLKTSTAETIRQRYWVVSGLHKLDALTRVLEAETFDGMIIFVRTKLATAELAEKLNARGFGAAALNGDIAQNLRERTIDQLKKGKLDILVATDVAARGLDVDRISHVINYDIPYDTESYVHRIGRTGRAGRSGEAILFVSPREQRTLRSIEQATKQKIELMEMPTAQVINDKRIAAFKQKISSTLLENSLNIFRELVEQYQVEHDVEPLDIAAALAKMAQGDDPLLIKDKPVQARTLERGERNDRPGRSDRRGERRDRNDRSEERRAPKRERGSDVGMVTYRIEVGSEHEVRPGNIVGAIANEAQLEGRDIGAISIFETFSTVDLPEKMSPRALEALKDVWVAGQQLQIAKATEADLSTPKPSRDRKFGGGKKRDFKGGKKKFGAPKGGKRSKFRDSRSAHH